MDTVTVAEAIEQLKDLPLGQELCAYCYAEIRTTDEGHKYCTNMMCLYDEDDD